jgi:hypothetical protein
MESLLAPDVLASTDEETRLICLRGRKYDAERAARLLPEFMQVGWGFFADCVPASQAAHTQPLSH